jgi:hypothetical protein
MKAKPPRPAKAKSPKAEPDAALRLRTIFEDLVMDRGETGILSFCAHVGIPIARMEGDAWWPAFSARYRDGAAMDQLCTDLATWGPIASRVMEIQLEARRHG